MKAYIFPGQGSQFCGMGQDIYIASDKAKEMFSISEEILGFPITEIMFGEDADLLKQTKVTQPAIFIHSVILSMVIKEKFKPDVVAGHSLGEFSALVSAGYISFEDGLNLVSKRAKAMQEACERNPSKMAAVIGLENKVVEDICNNIEHIVVPANYNCPQQLVISGTEKGIEDACKRLIEVGARRAIVLPVGGAFHSPLMEPARIKLERAIDQTIFKKGICPIYQNVCANPVSDIKQIKENIKIQLTSPVLWTQTMQNMLHNGVTSVTEIGPGKVLQGLFRKVNREIKIESANI